MATKAEMIDAVATRAGVSKGDAERTMAAFFDHVLASTRNEEKVAWPGFGSFSVSKRAARTGRNPQTGAPVKIKASKNVKFTASSTLKAAMNQTKAAAKSSAASKTTTKAADKSATKSSAGATKAVAAAKAPAKAAAKAPAKAAAKSPAKKK